MHQLRRIYYFGLITFTFGCLVSFYRVSNRLNENELGWPPVGTESEWRQQQDNRRKDEQNSYQNHRVELELEVNTPQKAIELEQQNSVRVSENVGFLGGGRGSRGDGDANNTFLSRLEEGVLTLTTSQCSSSSSGINSTAKVDIDMLKVYNNHHFEDVDGGVWEQGFPIEIDNTRFTATNKLHVFIVPHSHNDPGWVKTFEVYFQGQTKSILDNMLKFLTKNSKLKFIWAEISFFDLWWKGLTEVEKELVRKIVASKQLEFVSGGWVIPDEANSHYYSMLAQLIEGHRWLHKVFNYTVKSSWSIDSFGLTPTLPYLLKETKINSHVIQRVHYSIKKYLASRKELEFYWRQKWDVYNKTDVLTHVMPFCCYDTSHTCGPDPSVCCQFDYRQGLSHASCPSGKNAFPISAHNVGERAGLLTDQYKKKAMLYKTNYLLVPHGEDFGWVTEADWESRSTNYLKLIDYINSKPDEFQMEVHFSTLSEYFDALVKSSLEESAIVNVNEKLPSLAGDFFTYADIFDNYWSGYYTSRPFYKGFERELMAKVRSAHLIYTVTALKYSSNELPALTSKLTTARRWLSLFQHHDGITGTAKDHVMVDYGVKMFDAIRNCNEVIAVCLKILSSAQEKEEEASSSKNQNTFKPVESRLEYDKLNKLNTIHIKNRQQEKFTLAVFNNLPRERLELIKLQVDSYKVKVSDPQTSSTLDTQILPQFVDNEQINSMTFELNFLVKIPALTVKYLLIEYSPEIELSSKVKVTTFGLGDLTTESNNLENVFNVVYNSMRHPKTAHQILLENKWITVLFNYERHAVKPLKIIFNNGLKKEIEIGWWTYLAREPSLANKYTSSGLYVFLPGAPAKKLSEAPAQIRLIQSKFVNYIEIHFGNWLKQRITISNWEESSIDHQTIEIENTFNLDSKENFELLLKFKTDLKTKDVFYTDLNGFQMTKRQHFAKLPLQANYYPIPTAAFIEDDEFRLTVLSKQPLGGSSLVEGELEIMMDRTLEEDDNRGVSQAAKDNLWTKNTFRILFEKIHCQDADHKAESHPQLSLKAELTRNKLLNPVNIFYIEENEVNYNNNLESSVISQELECHLELVDSIPLEEENIDAVTAAAAFGLIIRRISFDDRFNTANSQQQICGDNYQPTNQLSKLKKKLKELFISVAEEDEDGFGSLNLVLQQTSLDFIHEPSSEEKESNNDKLNPMELVGFKFKM